MLCFGKTEMTTTVRQSYNVEPYGKMNTYFTQILET